MTANEALTSTVRALHVITAPGLADYALIDSGEGRKLERFGTILVDRPEPQAMWQPLRPEEWGRAHAVFAGEDEQERGRWRRNEPVPEEWPLAVMNVKLLCRLSAFRHLGLFPEQVPHWQWMLERLGRVGGEPLRVLNLFAYTGAASLIAARAGAEVTHVDASRKAIAWAKENQALSGLNDAPIRWILEDARKFVAREVRRGKRYNVVLVDPPKFGRGPNGEVWELFADLPALLRDVAAVMGGPAVLILTAYAIRASALALDGLVRETFAARPGEIDSGELAIAEENGQRLIGSSLFTRWSAT